MCKLSFGSCLQCRFRTLLSLIGNHAMMAQVIAISSNVCDIDGRVKWKHIWGPRSGRRFGRQLICKGCSSHGSPGLERLSIKQTRSHRSMTPPQSMLEQWHPYPLGIFQGHRHRLGVRSSVGNAESPNGGTVACLCAVLPVWRCTDPIAEQVHGDSLASYGRCDHVGKLRSSSMHRLDKYTHGVLFPVASPLGFANAWISSATSILCQVMN